MTRLAALATAFALVAFPASARPLDEVTASGALKIVVYEDNKPFSYLKDGQPAGIDVDVGRALARELGVEAQFITRMQGEKVDDDLRVNVWKGPLTGGGVGDVMLHVPTDRDLRARNPEAVIGNAYFEERIAVAIQPPLTAEAFDFGLFKTHKIGVKLGTVSDYFLMRYEGGALVENISHSTKASVGIDEFLAKEIQALMGSRAEIEGLLHERGAKVEFVEPPMPGIARTNWPVGVAVNEASRDLGYAIQAALEKMRDGGELSAICARHGVTYRPPVS